MTAQTFLPFGAKKCCPLLNLPIYIQPTVTGEGIVTSSDWKLDRDELHSAFNSKTKAIILNNPNNPLGKVFTRSEIQDIADLCIKHNVTIYSGSVVVW